MLLSTQERIEKLYEMSESDDISYSERAEVYKIINHLVNLQDQHTEIVFAGRQNSVWNKIGAFVW